MFSFHSPYLLLRCLRVIFIILYTNCEVLTLFFVATWKGPDSQSTPQTTVEFSPKTAKVAVSNGDPTMNIFAILKQKCVHLTVTIIIYTA